MRYGAVLIFILHIFGASAPALAEQPIEPETRALAMKLMELTDATGNAHKAAEIMSTQLLVGLQTAIPELTKQLASMMREEIMAMLEDQIETMTEDFIPIYARHFTKSELRDLIAFYSTATGQKTISVMPLILQDSLSATLTRMNFLIPKMKRQIRARLKEAGYE
ncbi:MAG: DUF2059 domain-containing protein [Proteobacteria bacterium]|nr:DUF2059 domain-containing protein [Pseudomonadota bacterium]